MDTALASEEPAVAQLTEVRPGSAEFGGWTESESGASSAQSLGSEFFHEVDALHAASSAPTALVAVQPTAELQPHPGHPAAFLTGTDDNRHQLMLMLLVNEGEHGKIVEAAQNGADVNLPDDSGRPPLLFAALSGHLECVRVLLQLGADANGRDRIGNTALHVAAQEGNHELIALLIASSDSAQVDDQSFSGRTPLHLACAAGHLMAVETLCTGGCALDSQDREFHTAEQLAELSGHGDCADTIRQTRASREVQERPDTDPDLVRMRTEIDSLIRRAGQLELSVKGKDSRIASQIAQSQQHVAESERIAKLLTSATTPEQLEQLGAESNRCVGLAEDCARGIVTSRAEAAGLRAELLKTRADILDATRMIADMEARATLGENARQAEWNFQQKDMESRLLHLQVKQLRRELVRHTGQNKELRTYIGRGYADWLHRTAAERAELEAAYNTAKGRLAKLEGSLPRSLELVNEYDSRVGKLRAQLADVNASVAAALNAAAEGETRASMAEENASIIQREIAVADKASRFAMTEKESAEVRADQAERQAQIAEERYANATKELTKVRTYVQNTETQLKLARKKVDNLERDNSVLQATQKAKRRAEEVARAELQRAESLRIERNDFERQVQVAAERIRELEGTFNTGQSDWWQRKLAHAERWTNRRERLYETNQSVVQVRDREQVDEQWQALNDMTRAVDVSLRRTCGQLKLRTFGVQTDLTYIDRPVAAANSEGEITALEEIICEKDREIINKHTRCLQHEKKIHILEVQLDSLKQSESRLRAFKLQVGPNREADKQKIYALQNKVDRLSRMLADPNPALKSVHQVLKASEENEAEAAAMAADARAMAAAKIAAEEAAATAAAEAEAAALDRVALRSVTFVFQKTGREVGISWGQRSRSGANEVFVESISENSQAARSDVPLGYVLKRVKHSKGEPDISKLSFRDIVNLLKAGLQYSPLEITVEEAPPEGFSSGPITDPADSYHQLVSTTSSEQPRQTTSAAPSLPAIAGPNARANILRQLAAATNERERDLQATEEEDVASDDENSDESVRRSKLSSRKNRHGKRTGHSRPRSPQRLEAGESSRRQSLDQKLKFNRSSGLDSQFAITALTRAEDARQREAARNVELQQRCEALSTDLVVQTDLVSALQDELSRAESLAARDMRIVAEEKERKEASSRRNTMAAALLRDVYDTARSAVEELKGVNQLQLQTVLAKSGSRPRKQDISDYGVLHLGMDATDFQKLGWIAETALATTLLSGWQVTRNPRNENELVFLHEEDGRIERTHPMQQRCQRVRRTVFIRRLVSLFAS